MMLFHRIKGLRFKLGIAVFLIVMTISLLSSLLMLFGLDSYFLGEFVKKSLALSSSDDLPAGYTIASPAEAELDALATSIRNKRDDLLYIATVDVRGAVRIHSDVTDTGGLFARLKAQRSENAVHAVRRVQWKTMDAYEVIAPVWVEKRKVADVFIGMDTRSARAFQTRAIGLLVAVSALLALIGLGAGLVLSSFILAPIRKLDEGISCLKQGTFRNDIAVSSADELGRLTQKFNSLANIFIKQRQQFKTQVRNLEKGNIATLRILLAAVDARDAYTMGHSTRVAKMSLLLGKRMGLKGETLKNLQIACLFHDVGKIRVPDHILNKRTELNEDENRFMMQHPEHGADILRLSDSLHMHIPAVLYHHEWYDGNGYPEGIKGDKIPLFASIISIADAYDAMTSQRPYRDRLKKTEAVQEILRGKGSQFNPAHADTFVEVLTHLWKEDVSPA